MNHRAQTTSHTAPHILLNQVTSNEGLRMLCSKAEIIDEIDTMLPRYSFVGGCHSRLCARCLSHAQPLLAVSLPLKPPLLTP